MITALLFGVSLIAATPVRVVVPDRENLQYLSFWTALGAGYFQAGGVSVELVVPGTPGEAEDLMRAGQASAAVLSPPMYLRLIADKQELVLVANLLANDPINLIVRGDIAKERKLDRNAPLADRLRALKGLKVGVAPGPPTRLKLLFESAGLDVKDFLEVVTVAGASQNESFGSKGVDALYAHTPFLERALVDQGAYLLVDQSKGEVAALAGRQIHALVVTRKMLEQDPKLVDAMVTAIARAGDLLRRDRHAAEQALLKVMPDLDRRHLARILELYTPALPKTVTTTAQGINSALDYFPNHAKKPDLSGIDLTRYVR